MVGKKDDRIKPSKLYTALLFSTCCDEQIAEFFLTVISDILCFDSSTRRLQASILVELVRLVRLVELVRVVEVWRRWTVVVMVS